MEREEKQSNVKIVYTIVEREKDGKKFWVRVGAAFTNRDGSINIKLDAVPVNGQLQVREYQPLGNAERDSSRAAA